MRRAAADSGWVALASAASRGLVFVAVVVLARLLSVADFAHYVVFLAAWTILVPFLDCGMWQLVTREASNDPGGRTFGFTTAADRARLPLWAGSLALALAGMLAGAWDNLALLAVLAAIGQAEIDTAAGELIGRRRFLAGSALRVAPSALALAGVAALPALGETTGMAVLVFTLARAVPGLAVRLAAPLRAGLRRLSLRQGVPFGLTTAVMLLYISSDVILLSAFGVSKPEVGTYGIAYRTVVGVQLVIPGAISLALYPRVAAATADRARRLVPLGAGLSAFACTALVAVLFLDLTGIFAIFGSTYADTIDTVRPLLLVLLPISMSVIYFSGLQARHRERSVLRLVTVVAAINLTGNLVLIPILGVRGALIATSVAEWASVLGALRLAVRHLGAPARDVVPALVLLGPAVLSFFDVPGALVSGVLALWLLIAWERDAFGLRSEMRTLRAGRRVEPVTTAPN